MGYAMQEAGSCNYVVSQILIMKKNLTDEFSAEQKSYCNFKMAENSEKKCENSVTLKEGCV